MKENLEIIKQHILQSDKDIEKTGVWLAYLKIVEYVKNTQQAYTDIKIQRKEGHSKLTLKDVPPPQEANMI